jgi:hypothetical protein
MTVSRTVVSGPNAIPKLLACGLMSRYDGRRCDPGQRWRLTKGHSRISCGDTRRGSSRRCDCRSSSPFRGSRALSGACTGGSTALIAGGRQPELSGRPPYGRHRRFGNDDRPHQPIESALYRVIEVSLGGAIGLAVTFLVLSARAHNLAIDAAAGVLDVLARALPDVFAGLRWERDAMQVAPSAAGHAPWLAR